MKQDLELVEEGPLFPFVASRIKQLTTFYVTRIVGVKA